MKDLFVPEDVKEKVEDMSLRAIIRKQYEVEFKENYDNVYKKVLNNHPSFENVLNKMSAKGDPLEDIKKKQEPVEKHQLYQLISEIEADKDLMDEDSELAKNVRGLTYRLKNAFDAEVKSSMIIEKNFYAEANAAKEVCKEEGISFEEFIENLEYRDAAYRKIFPTRAHSDANFNYTEKSSFELIQVMQDLGDFMLTIDELKEGGEALKNLGPSEEAMADLKKNAREYYNKRMDRIYS